MIEIALVAVPLLLAVAAAAWPSERARPWLLPAGGIVHTTLVWRLLLDPSPEPVSTWFGFDAVARAPCCR